MNAKKTLEIFKRFQMANPNPVTELVYHNPFELLVAVILSAQATDKSVNKATVNLFKNANTPKAILKMGEEKLREAIKTIGLFNAKAHHIFLTCQILVEKFNSEIPKTREELESLPGVGRKTANVILNTLYGESTIAVDTHIFRVANRTHLAAGKTPLAVEKKLSAIIPNEYLVPAHHWLVLHGRYVCVARKPLCSTCLIQDLCEYENKTDP